MPISFVMKISTASFFSQLVDLPTADFQTGVDIGTEIGKEIGDP